MHQRITGQDLLFLLVPYFLLLTSSIVPSPSLPYLPCLVVSLVPQCNPGLRFTFIVPPLPGPGPQHGPTNGEALHLEEWRGLNASLPAEVHVKAERKKQNEKRKTKQTCRHLPITTHPLTYCTFSPIVWSSVAVSTRNQ